MAINNIPATLFSKFFFLSGPRIVLVFKNVHSVIVRHLNMTQLTPKFESNSLVQAVFAELFLLVWDVLLFFDERFKLYPWNKRRLNIATNSTDGPELDNVENIWGRYR